MATGWRIEISAKEHCILNMEVALEKLHWN
jgi:hypothetical protein